MSKLLRWLSISVLIAGIQPLCWAATKVNLEVMNPRGKIAHAPYRAPNPRVTDLSAKKIALYWNGKAGGNNFFDALEPLLKNKYPTATIVRSNGGHQISEEMAVKLAKEVNTFIYGVGD